MDENKEIVENYDVFLKEQSNIPPIGIYRGRDNQNTSSSARKKEKSSEEILSTVAKQIKTMQSADCFKSSKKPSPNIYRLRNSAFVPLNMLPRDHGTLPPNHNFDNQHCTDTQLISMVQDAELKATYANCGITQEFEMSFFPGNAEESNDNFKNNLIQEDLTQENPDFPIVDISLKEPDLNKSLDIISSPDEVQIDDEIPNNHNATQLLNEREINTSLDIVSSPVDTEIDDVQDNVELDEKNYDVEIQFENRTQILNEGLEIENINQLDNANLPSQSSSPVLSIKSKRSKSKPSTPLVFNLDTFEHFEKIAQPIIEETAELEIAKKMINSQIYGKELLIQPYAEPILNNFEQISPIIELSHDLKINKDDFKRIHSKETIDFSPEDSIIRLSIPREDAQTDKSAFEDEILFSSDEEDNMYKSYQDLPFTCALETSFYNQTGVLEKTMYVGFQTASNKSIQVNKNSFCKAKSLLDNVENELKDITLTQLVKVCDSNNFSSEATPSCIHFMTGNVNELPVVTKDLETDNDSIADFELNNINIDSEIKDTAYVNIGNIAINKKEDATLCTDIDVTNRDKTYESNIQDSVVISDVNFSEEINNLNSGNATYELSDKVNKCSAFVTDNKVCYKDDVQDLHTNLVENITIDVNTKTEMEMDVPKEPLVESKDFKNSSGGYQIPILNIAGTQFQGFKTASNKTINLSKKSMSRINKVFHDILDEESDFVDESAIFSTKNLSIETASDVKIKYKEAEIKDIVFFNKYTNKVDRKIIENEIGNENASTSLSPDYSQHNDDKNVCSPVSNDVIFYTEKIDDEIIKEFEDDILTSPFKENPDLPKNNFVEFKTGNEKDINVEEPNEINHNTNIKVPVASNNNKEEKENNIDGEYTHNNIGFKTASNKDIVISKKALARIKDVFSDIDLDNDLTNKVSVNKESGNTLESRKSDTKINCNDVGFTTGNDTEIDISNLPINKGISLFQQVDNIMGSVKSTDILKPEYGELVWWKKVCVSDKALARTKKMFSDIDIATNFEDKINFTDVMEPPFYGFEETDIATFKKTLASSQKILEKLEDHKNQDKRAYEVQHNLEFNDGAKRFAGLQTANNRAIKISLDAMSRTKNLFSDIDMVEKDLTVNYPKEDKNIVQKFIGFQTASNKEVKVSEEALARSKKMFQDIEVQENFIDNYEQETLIGFQTASNKEAQSKGQKILQKVNTDNTDISLKTLKTETESSSSCFQTASNKEVKISEEALARSKNMFQELYTEILVNETASCFSGFQSVSKKEVTVSKDSLDESRKIFQEIDIETKKLEQKTSFSGFQTASNKELKVSEDALARSRKMFQEIDTETIKLEQKSKFTGFKTASKKEVQISEEALTRSRIMFQEIGIDTKKLEEKSSFSGFQTASKKEVNISAKALARSRKIFQEIETDINLNEEILQPIQPVPDIDINLQEFGFKTANKNKIPISKESLEKSRKLQTGFDKNINSLTTRTVKYISDKPLIENENLDNVINTQVLNNFEESLQTEDFLKEPTPKSKRSASPILSCPKAKKRKIFHTPYSQSVVKEEKVEFKPPKPVPKPTNVITFSENYKKVKEYTLKDLLNMEKESKSEEKTEKYLFNFNFEKMLLFKFSGDRNDIKSIEQESTLNCVDIKNIFLNSVNKKIVPDGWVEIHLQLILWKLISYEIKFPKTMANITTAKNVIDQLKYRYDKELYNAERPALRKIMEKDDTSMRMLVLCVVDILSNGIDVSTNPELLLTDGWYTIRAVIDKMLTKLVKNGKVCVGTKLITHGAELVPNDHAVSPWEDTSKIRLKLFGNSTRRARWYSRLGYHGNAAILSRLSNVSQDGGKVSKLRVFVTRVYPALYVEKFEDGSTLTRSERLEGIHQMKYETERQGLLEKIYEDVEREIYDQESQDSEADMELGVKRKCTESGSQIAKMMKHSKDPAEFRSHLTASQTTLLNNYTAVERERLIQKIQDRVQSKMVSMGLNINRNVVPLLKIRVAGLDETNNGVEISKAMLSIWKPNDAVIEIIKEATWIEVLNVVPTAVRYSEIQVSAGRQSIFSQSKYKENEKIRPYCVSLKRTCYLIKDLVRNPAMKTDYNEIDTVGIVFQIDPSNIDFNLNKHQFQNVYLCDIEQNIICVNFWSGLKKFGFENVLDTGQIVTCMNLQRRAGNIRKGIPQYRVTEFTYFTKTPKNESARNIIDELNKKFIKIDKRKFFEECVALKNNYSTKFQSSDMSPYRFPNMEVNLSRNRIFLDSPLAQKSNKIDENLNLTGLDFESTFKQTDTQELSPKTLLRKKQVQQKMAKLQMYGEPPPLSPMQIINISKNAGNAYKSPLVSKTDVPISVASEKKNVPIQKENEKIQCSPVINFNRTYVKRNTVNPVRLNFSNNVAIESSLGEVIDDFAEDFDGSPPLSLD